VGLWQDKDPGARDAALCGALSELPNAAYTKTLEARLEMRDFMLRQLEKLGPGHDAAIPILEDATARNWYSEIRTAARRAIARIKGETIN